MNKIIATATVLAAFVTIGIKSNAQNFEGISSQISATANDKLTLSNIQNSQNYSLTFASTQPKTLAESVSVSEAPKVASIYSDGVKTTDTQSKSPLDLLLGTGVAGSLLVLRRKTALRA